MTKPLFQAGTLAGRAALSVAGEDARHFLHNLLTADIARLGRGDAAYAALLTPQGKILFDLLVFDDGDRFLVDCAAAARTELLKRLTFYRLRAKVTLAAMDDLEVVVAHGEELPAPRYRDPRCDGVGWRGFAPRGSLPAAANYDEARLALGLADSDADIGSAELFPHEANLDQLGAMSFSKGCYVGQEVVSRMEHRGLARNRILPISLSAEAPPKGSEIRSGDRHIGTLLSSRANQALALIRLDRLAEADQPLLTQGVAVKVHKPHWVRYDVAGAMSP